MTRERLPKTSPRAASRGFSSWHAAGVQVANVLPVLTSSGNAASDGSALQAAGARAGPAPPCELSPALATDWCGRDPIPPHHTRIFTPPHPRIHTFFFAHTPIPHASDHERHEDTPRVASLCKLSGAGRTRKHATQLQYM